MTVLEKILEARERIMKNVRISNGHWFWEGKSWDATGKYAYITIDKRTMLAKRVLYMLHNEADPGEREVRHFCSNSKCMRPEHMILKNKPSPKMTITPLTKKVKEKHNFLDRSEAPIIRTRLLAGESALEIANDYGANVAIILKIKSGEIFND